MQILLIAATEQEIQQPNGPCGQVVDQPNIDVLVTGVGSPAALYHLQKRLQQIDYDMVVQAGIAGSFTNGPALEETVIVQQDTFADLGITEKENFSTIFDVKLSDKNEFPFTDGWLLNKSEWLHSLLLKKVNAITVNTVSDDKSLKLQREKTFQPGIETMEGAALHYICLQENIPFLQIRTVSNLVGERDKTKWKLKESIENLNNELLKLINHLTLKP
jgi:futalosine hydrolase